jgi:PPOX class probable FMN-dependent enzyme
MSQQLTLDDLDESYAEPTERTLAKTLDHLDGHMARFIATSPFCVLASVGPEGTVDASPRGGGPGFIRVAGPKSLLMPDRPGNNRLDTFRNILGGSGEVALIFFIPGMDETLRVGGRASLNRDPVLMESMIEFGKPPRAILEIAVREAFLHCPKALMRSRLWDPAAHIERSAFPSLGEMIHAQTGMGTPDNQAQVIARSLETL